MVPVTKGCRAKREEGKRAGEWDRWINRKRDEKESGIQKGKAVTQSMTVG